MKILDRRGVNSYARYVDIKGNPVERTRDKHPYSYDAYVQWRGGENHLITEAIYSDRMMQRDYNKFRDLCEKHFGDTGQMFGSRKPKKIESFLRDYLEKPALKLIVIQECCNVSSGYPIWVFHFQDNAIKT